MDSIYQWQLPKHILNFLANVLPENLTFKLQTWNDFKQQLFDFYDHRLNNSPELLGAANTNYMSLDEYFMLYFLDKYKLRH